MTARILIVDDVAANRRLLEAKLVAEYYQTKSAADGFEALEVAAEWQPDLILLDIMMPSLDGYEVCRRLKSKSLTVHIPVVMVTALGEPAERVRGLEAGADDFLTKPVEFDTLLARVRSLVRLKRLLDELQVRGETARALGMTTEMITVPSVAGSRAVVVDDWETGARHAQDTLAREGVVTGRASSEAEAISLTNALNFDLIVLSLSMAADDPLRLASYLRASDATRDIPLLLIADPDQHQRVLRGFDLGANDWVMRPVDENELRVRARNQIRRKIYQDRLRSDLGHALEMALTDALTGLYNQRYLVRHITNLLASQQPDGAAVIMVDVDQFKAVNDRWGHAVGDDALKAIAGALRQRTRVMDSVARYGGEEFVVVMPRAAMPEAVAIAERLCQSISEIIFEPEPGERHTLTVSAGVACAGETPVTVERLLQQADQAMYRAKRAGGNRVGIAP